jgi:hypothetical protein
MDLEARELIARYLAGNMDAAELENELEEVAWDSDPEDGPSFALRMLHEYSNGDWTEDELHQRLDPIGHTYVHTITTSNSTGTSAQTTRQVSPARVETLHVAVSA